jgi:hypothetical protein
MGCARKSADRDGETDGTGWTDTDPPSLRFCAASGVEDGGEEEVMAGADAAFAGGGAGEPAFRFFQGFSAVLHVTLYGVTKRVQLWTKRVRL